VCLSGTPSSWAQRESRNIVQLTARIDVQAAAKDTELERAISQPPITLSQTSVRARTRARAQLLVAELARVYQRKARSQAVVLLGEAEATATAAEKGIGGRTWTPPSVQTLPNTQTL